MGKKDAIERLDEQARVGSEIYKSARAEADKEIALLREKVEAARTDGEMIGFIKRGQINRKFDKLMDAVALYKAKESKEYKKAGLTWAGFCDAAGYEVRTADRIIEDLCPVFEAFSDAASDFAKVGLSKIRYLGKSIGQLSEIQLSANSREIIIGDEQFPFLPEHIDDINAAIDSLKDSMERQEKDHAATLKASERVQKDLHNKLVQTQKECDALQEKLSAEAKAKGLTEDEDTFLKAMERARMSFDAAIMNVDPERMAFTLGENPTDRMIAAYFSLLDYARRQILCISDDAEEKFGAPAMFPERAWRPGMAAEVPPIDYTGREWLDPRRTSGGVSSNHDDHPTES